LVQALPSSPSSAGLVPFPSASVFFSPCPFRVCPFWARCVVLVFSLSLFLCVPLFASRLSNFHFIFIFISLSLSFHPPRCCGACVCTICIDVKLLISAGVAGEQCSQRPTKTLQCSCVNVPALYIYIHTHIVPPLGAYKTQLGGTYILSLLFYMVDVYCDYTSLYNYI